MSKYAIKYTFHEAMYVTREYVELVLWYFSEVEIWGSEK